MNRVAGALAVSLGVVAAACGGGTTITGSGTIVDEMVSVGSFDAVEISDAFDVTFSAGTAPTVTVHADDNVIASLDVGVSGSTLHIGVDRDADVEGATLKADVTVTALTALTLSGSARATLPEGFEADALTVGLSGAADLSGTAARLGTLAVSASGASAVMVAGTADTLRLQASGASRLGLEALAADTADVTLSGACQATVSVSQDLAYRVSGGSTLTFLGDPTITEDQVSGGSTVTRGG